MQEVDEGYPMCIADFRDTHGLAFTKSGGFVGWSMTGGMRLGRPPFHLVDGVWYMHEDTKGQTEHPEVQLRPGLLVLKPLP